MTGKRMAMAARIAAVMARREMRAGLRGGLRGFRLLVACLAVGVAAIAGVGTIRAGIEAGLVAEGARLLGGDAELRLTYRRATAPERAYMAGIARRVSEVVLFRSMLELPAGSGGAGKGSAGRLLVEVKAVDDVYPLVGRVGLAPDMPLARALAGQGGLPGIVVARSAARRAGLVPGQKVALAGRSFVFMAELVDEPDAAGSGLALGPRVIVGRGALAGTALIAPGAAFSARYRLDLPAAADLAALAEAAKHRFRGAGMTWRDRRDAAPELRRAVQRLGHFMVLVGLSSLVVGGVGVAASVTALLAARTAAIATLRALGAGQGVVLAAMMLEIMAAAAIGIAAGVLVGVPGAALAAPLLSELLPVPMQPGIRAGPALEAAVYGILVALIFALWPLGRIATMRPAALWRQTPGAAGKAAALPSAALLVAVALLVALLVGAAGSFVGSQRLALWTFAALAGALTALWGVARLLRVGARRAARRLPAGWPAARAALAALSAPRGEAGLTLVSLGLGLSVLAAIGQIDANLRRALDERLPKVAPSHFFLDIQKDQIGPFLELLRASPGVERVEHVPMLRGIITRINGRPAREVAGAHWVLRGDRGVSYAARPPAGTRLVAGSWWPENDAGPPQLSFSAHEAAEMGLGLGDRVTVNILGREIEAPITSLREVDFSSGGIGFVMMMNPAALAGAPHGFIATAHVAPAAEGALLRALGQALPNVTAVSVRGAIARVRGIVGRIGAAIRWAAGVTLLAGLLVLMGAAAAAAPARTREAAILRTLGASRLRILSSFALRSALVGAAAGSVALAAGVAAAWAVTAYVMESRFVPAPGSALVVVGLGICLSLLAGLVHAAGPLRRRPAGVLRPPE